MLVDSDTILRRPVKVKNVVSLPETAEQYDTVYLIVQRGDNIPGLYIYYDGWKYSMYPNALT